MNLEKAIKIVESIKNSTWFLCSSRTRRKILSEEEQQAIDTVLNELNRLKEETDNLRKELVDISSKSFQEGYQDGFEQAKFHCEMDKLPYERTIKIKDEYLQLMDFFLIDYDGCNTVESLKELIDETREYIHKALKNDDKSVVYRRGDDKGLNILGEEVE